MTLFDGCVYTILDEDTLLAADRGALPSAPLTEFKRWTRVETWMKKAAKNEESVPLVLADAKNVHRLLGWAVLDSLDVQSFDKSKGQTTFSFKNLEPLLGHARSEFCLLDGARPLSDKHIRPYVLLQTPAFLRALSAKPRALLSDWLCTPEAIALVFERGFTTEDNRADAIESVRRILSIVDEIAPNTLQIVVTPRRIRLNIGAEVIAELGAFEDECIFYITSSNQPQEDEEEGEEEEETSTVVAIQKWETEFRQFITKLASTYTKTEDNSRLLREYLAKQP